MELVAANFEEAESSDDFWVEDEALLLQETVADLTELQVQVEHARHHASDVDADNDDEVDRVLDGTMNELATWIDKVLDVELKQNPTEETYENLCSSVREEELSVMPATKVVALTHDAIAEVVTRIEERALRAEPGEQMESILLNLAQSLRSISDSLEAS